MAQMKMLRQVMSPADIYTHADTICDMLRDHYGSYDADSLDEVMVEETFAQRLAAKGYDLLPEGAEVDDRPMAPPPSRRELPRAEISQLPLRRPVQNGSGGVPLRRREPSSENESQLPLRRDGDSGGVPLRRSQPAADGEPPVRRNLPAGDGDRGGPMRRRPAMGEGESIPPPRRRPMASGDAGPVRSRPEGSFMPERVPLRPERPAEPVRPAAQNTPERVVTPAEQRIAQEPAPSPQTVEPAAVAPQVAVPSEVVAQAPVSAPEAAAPASAEPKLAPKPRARRTTRAKVASSASSEPQGEA